MKTSEGVWPLPSWGNQSAGKITQTVAIPGDTCSPGELGTMAAHSRDPQPIRGWGGSGKSSWKISLFFLPDFSVEASKRIRVHRVDSVCKTWGMERVQVWVLGVHGCERPGKDEGHAVEGDERERRTR